LKRILLAVSGLSPQVITETLYCLQQEQRQVDAIHVITTRTGKELILARLLGGGCGKYYQFLEEYGMQHDEIDFHPGHIHTLCDSNGREQDDIRTQDDNERLLQLSMELTWELTGPADTAVYFLVAGGRKTMTSCLTLAAQLYGRPQDRMYHVLVSPEFESSCDFWYPSREPVHLELTDLNGDKYFKDSSYAQVELVTIPFFSLRSQFSESALARPHSPGTLMTSLVKDEKRMLTISLGAGTVSYGDMQLDMHKAQLALLVFFAELKVNCLKEDCKTCRQCFISADEVFARQQRITEIYMMINGGRELSTMSDTGITSLNAENFNSYKSKIKKNFKTTFGAVAEVLYISPSGRRPETRYGIIQGRQHIAIDW
jgi:CRISPR-associated protein Csx14